MQFKTKLRLGTIIAAIVPAAIVAGVLDVLAIHQSQAIVTTLTQQQLESIRTAKKYEVERYFTNIQNQVAAFAKDTMIVDAVSAFSAAFTNTAELGAPPGAAERSRLRDYYVNDFAKAYASNNNGETADARGSFDALDPAAVTLQYRYIAANPSALGSKDDYAGPSRDAYDMLHARYHPAIRDFLQRFDYHDIFLVDADSGRVVYSVFKELDYATDLLDGPYKDSALADAFRRGRALDAPGDFAMVDFKPYRPSLDAQAAFVASPVFNNGQKTGVLIFQLPIEPLVEITRFDRAWRDVGLGDTGDIILLGTDGLLRSEPRGLLENPSAYGESLAARGHSQATINSIRTKGSALGTLSVETPATAAAHRGESGFTTYDAAGRAVLSSYSPLDIPGLDWSLLVELDADEAYAPVAAERTSIAVAGLIVLGFTIAIGLAAGWWGARILLKPLNRTLDETQAIASAIESGHGDFTTRVGATGRDEFAELARSLNALLAAAHGYVGSISNAIDELRVASQEADDSASALAASIGSQVSEATNVATAVNEMTASIDEVARNAVVAAERAKDADLSAREGSTVINASKANFEDLAGGFNETVEVVSRLESASQEIGTVLSVIQGIAEQTNLLALNAAIEAARAGEQGRGFAVVADEVRTLAGRTQESTLQIESIIEELQAKAGDAARMTRNGHEILHSGVENACRADEALQLIARNVSTIDGMNTQVATAVEEQSATCSEINANLQRISAEAERLSNIAATSDRANDRLKALTERLYGAVSQVRV